MIYNEKDVKTYMEESMKDFELGGVELTDEDIAAVLKDANENQDLVDAADSYLYGIRNTLDAGLESGKEEER